MGMVRFDFQEVSVFCLNHFHLYVYSYHSPRKLTFPKEYLCTMVAIFWSLYYHDMSSMETSCLSQIKNNVCLYIYLFLSVLLS